MTLRTKVNLFSWIMFLLLLNHMGNQAKSIKHDKKIAVKIAKVHKGGVYVN